MRAGGTWRVRIWGVHGADQPLLTGLPESEQQERRWQGVPARIRRLRRKCVDLRDPRVEHLGLLPLVPRRFHPRMHSGFRLGVLLGHGRKLPVTCDGRNFARSGHRTGDPKKVAMFAYDTGMTMYGLKAPARRIGFFFYRDTAAAASKEGWTLFDAAVAWAVQSPAPGASGGRR